VKCISCAEGTCCSALLLQLPPAFLMLISYL
jgi:hypothetical protein